MKIEEIGERCFIPASKLLEKSHKKKKFFKPMLDIRAADGSLVALFIFIQGFEDDDGETRRTTANWRDVMGYCASLSMAGFARAEYATVISDSYVKRGTFDREGPEPDPADYPRGTFHRMFEQKDPSVSEGLLVQTYSRTDSVCFSTPYRRFKNNIVWDKSIDDRGFQLRSGYIYKVMHAAFERPTLTTKIAETLGVPEGELWAKITEFIGEGTTVTARAHQDMATVRVVLAHTELLQYVIPYFFPENEEGAEIMEKSLARMAEEGVVMPDVSQRDYQQFINMFKNFDRRAQN